MRGATAKQHSVPYEITFRLPRHLSSVPRARAALQAVLGGRGIEQETLDTAELIHSELVTNALRARAQAQGDREVHVRIARSEAEGMLHIEVTDAGAGRPEVKDPGAGGAGKTVWAEVKSPGVAPDPVDHPVDTAREAPLSGAESRQRSASHAALPR
ncbi:ATP-binding protein [Streptomyces sp. NPDC003032]